jgi:DNA-binding NtrC family response regulator
MPSLLIVEDEAVLARNLAKSFAQHGFTVQQASGIEAARRMLADAVPDVVLTDLRLPDGNGLDLLDTLQARAPDVPVVVMTAFGSVADAVKAMQRGARDFVQKPLELAEIRIKVEGALRHARQDREVSYYRQRDVSGAELIGDSPAIKRLRELLGRIAHATAPGRRAPTVLLLGETGAGKGHVARLLHAMGGRRGGPFIEVNCTALPENLVESELFGHERGAFTDAKVARPGLFETADGGAIFLDEIGHISPALQSKFLRVIDDKVLRRVGSTQERPVDVKVIAATNRDLEAAVRLGEFREDLYQRLSVAVIRIPPLRERGADVSLLARAFLETSCRRYGMPPRSLSPDAETALTRYTWPGNVRELGNVIERAVLFSDAEPIRERDLGLPVGPDSPGRVRRGPAGNIVLDFPDEGLSLEAVERALLTAALAKAGGNRSGAARLLGISRDTLRYRLEKYGLGE